MGRFARPTWTPADRRRSRPERQSRDVVGCQSLQFPPASFSDKRGQRQFELALLEIHADDIQIEVAGLAKEFRLPLFDTLDQLTAFAPGHHLRFTTFDVSDTHPTVVNQRYVEGRPGVRHHE